MSKNSISVLQHYLRRLTSLGGNNRSLFLPRLPVSQLMDVHSFGFLKNQKSFSILEALIHGKANRLCQVLDSRLAHNNKLSQRLKQLQRADTFLQEERGSFDLHVGWPFVHGKFSDGTLVRCPLLYFPVRLTQAGNDWLLQPRSEVGISFNKTFLLAYAYYNNVSPAEELIDFSFDDAVNDSTVFRTQLYQLLKDKLEINFNSMLFTDEVLPFEDFDKETFDETHDNGELKLQPEAVLGIFPQAGSELVPDYVTLLTSAPTKDIDDVFNQLNSPVGTQRLLKEESIFTPLFVDEWQEEAVRKIKSGNSLVVQGPPGTGKSQLITNVICDAIATGKKVLLVCQKRVALDVVYQRLGELGVHSFIGLVHDYKNDRRSIYENIASQIEGIQDFKNLNRSADVIQVERLFFQVCRTIDSLTDELEEFRSALFSDKECGLSAKQLYLTSFLSQPAVSLSQEYSLFDFVREPLFIALLKRYVRYANQFEADSYPWKQRVSFAASNFSELKRRTNTIEALHHFKTYFEERSLDVTGIQLNVIEGESLLQQINEISAIKNLVHSEKRFHFFKGMMLEKDDETSLLWLDNMRLLCMNCFSGEGIEASLPSQQLTKFQQVLLTRMEAKKRSIIKFLRWEWFSKDKFWLKRVLIANGLSYKRQHFEMLEARLDNRLNFEHQLTALRLKRWLKYMPTHYSAHEWLEWFDDQKAALQAKLHFTSLRELHQKLTPVRFEFDTFQNLLKQLEVLLRDIQPARERWLQSLTPYQILQLLNSVESKDKLLDSLQHDFEDLVAFDTLKNQLTSPERSVMDKLFTELQHWDDVAFEKLFKNSLRLAWLNHLENKYPVLRLVSTQRFQEMEYELKAAVEHKHKLTKELLLLRLRERVYERIEYNRLSNPVTYRDLAHQVNKKKKIWPLRKVIAQFDQEIFDLMPCWMASPESVSALFPFKKFFDLVIFDEASQCFSEHGIPAIARGKQVLIAGDSQQLQPSDFYKIRWSEEETDSPDIEVISLLDLAARYLPTTYLQGHYRSQSIELIDFSNQHFYKNRLKVLPSFAQLVSEVKPISYIKVDGVWDKQINVREADEVINTVLKLQASSSAQRIGIITFNAPQQQLIIDKLEQTLAEKGSTLPSSIFIKNIENVQGDEADVIIFSIGYAPDKKGKINMQFGSLSIPGGENRLNVAITRAREKIIVITSIWPEQLEVDELKNTGPKLLKKYLEYVRVVSADKQLNLPFERVSYAADWYLTSKLHSEISRLSYLPFSDMMVFRLYKPEALLLTDDEYYREALSVKAAHAYTMLMLERKGWRFQRFFSRQFWLNSERVLMDIKKLLN